MPVAQGSIKLVHFFAFEVQVFFCVTLIGSFVAWSGL